uniref:Uncharacterized protein n=1 Tax=Salix viminalis TaxID=40686 RepID=A0A6N2M896_SALVM
MRIQMSEEEEVVASFGLVT